MKILVSANNPGGANAILPVVKEISKDNDLVIALEGKAKDFFKNENIDFIEADDFTETDIEELFKKNNFDLFLAGTSLGQTIDKKILANCKQNNVTSIYVLDFWSNYWQRFSSEGNKDFKFLPDYVCVIDEKAREEMIKEGFKSEAIKVTGNPYFDIFTENITKDNEIKDRVLFISQPLDGLQSDYNEYQVLQDLIDVLPVGINLVVRLHPREAQGKFDNLSVDYDDEKKLEESISKSGLIIGMNSMVLFQSAIAGKQVISYQPNVVKDVLPSNSLGLSKLVKKKNVLKKILNYYASGKNFISEAKDNNIINEATENVINFINSLN